MTQIEWTDETWNVFVGCSKVSEGCRNCYAINQAYRNNAMATQMPNPGRMKYYEGLTQKTDDRINWTGLVRFVPEALELPLMWKKPRKIFVNSMSDLFHESIPFEQIDQVFALMALTLRHTYQILTKRPARMLEYLRSAKNRVRIAAVDMGRAKAVHHADIESCQWDWPLPNVWLGVTVENQKAADERIPLLLQAPATLRFLSVEPMLEKIDIKQPIVRSSIENGTGLFQIKNDSYVAPMIDWVIVGGESGPKARPFYLDWARSLLWQCQSSSIPIFIKQLGGNVWDRCSVPVALGGLGLSTESCYQLKLRNRKGGDIQEWPERVRVREFPHC